MQKYVLSRRHYNETSTSTNKNVTENVLIPIIWIFWIFIHTFKFPTCTQTMSILSLIYMLIPRDYFFWELASHRVLENEMESNMMENKRKKGLRKSNYLC